MPEYRKKLIEVALPLEAINKESAREKSIRHGHPSTLHLWWSRKPLATCRSVLFAQMVDDPSSQPNEFPTQESQQAERQRLFLIIEELIKWDNSTNEAVLHAARVEIARSAARNHGVSLPLNMTPTEVLKHYAPLVLDPFAGGGSIPLEAQRLGLEAHASDLNPVAVLINKALIEIPPKFMGRAPINPEAQRILLSHDWYRTQGLVDDIRYYGKWMRNEAERRVGNLYPKVTLPKEYGGSEATVIAWLWARTVTCPNPACGTQMPLTNKWWLSKKKGNEAWVEPHVDNTVVPPAFHFTVRTGNGKPLAGTVNRQGAICIACGTPVPFEYIRSEGKARRMNVQLMAIVAEGQRGRVYLSPLERQVKVAAEAKPEWIPDMPLPYNPRNFNTPIYGLDTFDKLFTPRQLLTLTTYSTLLREAQALALADAIKAGLSASDVPLREGGKGALAYADALSIYLAFAIDKTTTTNTSACAWQTEPTRLVQAFGRQTIPMIWDYAEANPFSHAAGDYNLAISSLTEVIDRLLPGSIAAVQQKDAAVNKFSNHYLISRAFPNS